MIIFLIIKNIEINNKNLITILSPRKILCIYITILFYNCQCFFYDKFRQIITEINTPIKSPTNAASSTPLVFFIFTILVYIAIVYNVVSVEPIIVEAIIPILLSTPYCCIISVPIAIEALP